MHLNYPRYVLIVNFLPAIHESGLSSFYVSHYFCCDISFRLNFLQCIHAVRVLTSYLICFEFVPTAVSDIFEAFTVYMSIQMPCLFTQVVSSDLYRGF